MPLRLIDTDDGAASSRWTVVPGAARFDPGGSLYAYVCPRCGHVDLFMDVPEEGDQPE